MNRGLLTSNTDQWATPRAFFDELDREFRFTLDVCADAANAKCEEYFTEADDGLAHDWRGVCWCNPPYGRGIGEWVPKACLSSLNGATVVCLVPARTDTAWWHDWALRAQEIRYVRGRIKFGDATAGAPFPSAVLVFRAAPGNQRLRQERSAALDRLAELSKDLPLV